MNSKVISVDVAERRRQAENRVQTAKDALAMAEAELRVWQSVEAEAHATVYSKGRLPKPDVGSPLPRRDLVRAGRQPPLSSPSPKRDRRPAGKWMSVLALLEDGPKTHESLASAVLLLGIERRALGDQLRRYVDKLGLLVDDGATYALTDRARRFLAAYRSETAN